MRSIRFGFLIVAWAAVCGISRSALGQIPQGWEIVEIFPAGTEYNCGPPDINDRGQIVFERRLWPSLLQTEIMLHDRGKLSQLTDDQIRDVSPRINKHAHIVWSRDLSEDGLLSVVRLRDGKLDIVSELAHAGIDGGADINDAGYIVWTRFATIRPYADQLLLFDGASIRQITNDTFSNQTPRINGLGHFVFTRYDFSVDPWLSRIFACLNLILLPLSQSQLQVQRPDLNDLQQVVWAGPSSGVELWEGGVTRTIILDSNTYGPRINNRGDICTSRWDTLNRNAGLWLKRRELPFVQLTDGVFGGNLPAMNNRGEIAFQFGRVPNAGIALFSKPAFVADLDLDGDVDLRDLAFLQQCFGLQGPGIEETCWSADTDNDSVVGSDDFKTLADFIGGPE